GLRRALLRLQLFARHRLQQLTRIELRLFAGVQLQRRRPDGVVPPTLPLLRPGVRHLSRLRRPASPLSVEHDPEKWMPVFGKDHAQAKKMSEESDSTQLNQT